MSKWPIILGFITGTGLFLVWLAYMIWMNG
jgi:hypothetical protein